MARSTWPMTDEVPRFILERHFARFVCLPGVAACASMWLSCVVVRKPALPKLGGTTFCLRTRWSVATRALRSQNAQYLLYSVNCSHKIPLKINILRRNSINPTFCFISANYYMFLVYSASTAPGHTLNLTINLWFTFCLLLLYSTERDE